MPKRAGENFEKVEVRSRAEWRAWLAANHGQSASIWLVTCRKHHPDHVPYEDTVREALCFGWIDSVPRKVDEDRTSHLMSPRKSSSAWSGINKRYVAELEAEGLMAEPGRVAIERARANGMWSFLDDVERLEVPPDLAAAFEAVPGSREAWDGFPPSARRGILAWIKLARRAGTRATRIEKTALEAAEGRRAIG